MEAGSTVAVIGCGGVGLNVIQGAQLAGAARIIAVDLMESKLAAAKEFGATDTIDGSDKDAVQAVQQMTGGGVDYRLRGDRSDQDRGAVRSAWRSVAALP